jgi:GAF domain-containing protein
LIDTRKGLQRVDEPLEQTLNPTPSQIAGVSQGLRSLIAVPLISGDKVIGGLVLRAKSPTAYGNRDLELAELIAAQIAGAIANAQMHIQIQREADERAALAEIGRIIDSSVDIQDVYQRFIEVVNRLVPSNRITVALLNSQGDAVINSYVWGTEVEGKGVGGITPVTGTTFETLIKTRRGVMVRMDPTDDYIAQFPGQAVSIVAGLRAMIVVPMVAEDEMIGGLLLSTKNTDAYGARDVEIAELIAAQIAGAVANAQLHADVQKQALERQVLNEIGRIISSTLHVEEVYDKFADRVRILLPFDRLIINIIDPDILNFKRVYSTGLPTSNSPSIMTTPSQGSFLHKVITQKQSILFSTEQRPVVEKTFPGLLWGIGRSSLSR